MGVGGATDHAELEPRNFQKTSGKGCTTQSKPTKKHWEMESTCCDNTHTWTLMRCGHVTHIGHSHHCNEARDYTPSRQNSRSSKRSMEGDRSAFAKSQGPRAGAALRACTAAAIRPVQRKNRCMNTKKRGIRKRHKQAQNDAITTRILVRSPKEESGTMCGEHAVQSPVCPESNRHMKL